MTSFDEATNKIKEPEEATLGIWIYQRAYYKKAKEYKAAIKKLFEVAINLWETGGSIHKKHVDSTKAILEKYLEERKKAFGVTAVDYIEEVLCYE